MNVPVGQTATMIDPITFEVLKHRLWQINDEQSVAIRTISSSPIVVEGNDFNVGLFTREGQLTTAGIGSLVHVGTMGDALRSVMRLATKIRKGDVYLVNDPFLGALHQNDVVLVSPFFCDDRIVLWVGNVLHHPDVGGIDEGSFCVSARNLYQDPPRYFLKLVDGGEFVSEVEYTFVTNSRLPDMVALDLKAQLGAIHAAQSRLGDLIEECGAEAIETVAQESVVVAERQVRDRISRLPFGTWMGEAYMDGARVGDVGIHRVVSRLSREDDTLHFDFTGSSAQVDAAVNCTYHATVAGAIVPLYSFLCQGEIDWNDGLKRCVRVTAPEGTVVNATFPAPVSICTIGFRWLVTVAAAQAVAKMLNVSDDYRDRVCASWNVSSNCNNIFGQRPDGRRVGALLSDHRGGGAAARSFGDGFSHAGQITSYASSIGNVEGAEWKLPILYAFRRRLPDSGGPGKFRGGLTAAAAVVPYKVEQLVLAATNTAGTEASNAHGIEGGYPGAGSHGLIVRQSEIWSQLRAGALPDEMEGFGGQIEYLPSKAKTELGKDDVLILFAPGGGGYGDPLERPPDRVARDVRENKVSRARAHDLYGVILDAAGKVDAAETERRRDLIRRERRQGTARPWQPVDDYQLDRMGAERAGAIGDGLKFDWERRALSCARCDAPLTGVEGGVVVKDYAIGKPTPWTALPSGGDSPNFRLRETACARCGHLIEVREFRMEVDSSEDRRKRDS